MKLSVSMIVRSEESCLTAALASIAGADELVVVDTSLSSDPPDRSMEIAAEFGAKTFKFPWVDDFAAARNFSLKQCTGDWILSIDADEELELEGINKIHSIISMTKPTIKRLGTIMRAKSNNNEHLLGRLFRHVSDVCWKGEGHETIGEIEQNTDIVISYGYSDAHKNDPYRMLRILNNAVIKNPKSTRNIFYLAREYWYCKDYSSAIEWYKKYLLQANWMPERADAWLMLARCYWLTQQGEQAREACLNAISNNANFKEALLFMAEISWPKNAMRWKEFAELATNEDVLFIRTLKEV